MAIAYVHPDVVEFSEGIVESKKICACVSDLDCVADIIGITFADDVPQSIIDNISVSLLGKIAILTNNVSNENNQLYEYAVEMVYQKPLIETKEATDKVMAEHVEKLKNDEGIKAIEQILETLNEHFPDPPPPIMPTVVNDITNPLVVGNEINGDDMLQMQVDFNKMTNLIKDVVYNYFRPDFKNVTGSNVNLYVSREMKKIEALYKESIASKLVESSLIIAEGLISNINGAINNSDTLAFSDSEKFIIKTNLTELNNLLVNVYSAYNSEYDAGILQQMNENLSNKTDLGRCS